MRQVALLLLLACAGCDTKQASPLPTAPSQPPQAVTIPIVPAVPVIGWSTDSTAHHPGVTVRPDRAVSAIRLVDAQGQVYSLIANRERELPEWGWYWVQGQIAGLWSAPVPVPVFPNPCGGCIAPEPPPVPVVPMPEPEPTPCAEDDWLRKGLPACPKEEQ